MTQYAMTTRTGSVVIKTKANSLEEAVNFFAKMKQSITHKTDYLQYYRVSHRRLSILNWLRRTLIMNLHPISWAQNGRYKKAFWYLE